MTHRKNFIIAICIIALAIVSIFLVNRYKKTDQESIRTSVEVGDSAEQKEGTAKVIQDIQTNLQEAQTKNASDIEKAQLFMQLGASQQSLGKLAEAKAAYESAAQLQPNDGSVYAGLFTVLRDMRDYASADSAIKKAVELNSNDWNLWRNYITYERYQMKLAMPQLEQLHATALEKTSHHINIVTVYAVFLEEVGNPESALKLWQEAETQFPQNEDYKKEIVRLQTALKVKQ